MSEHNALKYGTLLTIGASRVTGVAEDEQGLSRLSETLQPSIDLWSKTEWAYSRGEHLYSLRVTVPAVVARIGMGQFLFPGPTTQKYLAVIESIRSDTQAVAGLIYGSAQSVTNPVVNFGRSRDSRYGAVGNNSVAQVVTGDVASSIVFPQIQLELVANTPRTVEFVIAPGDRFDINEVTVNIAMNLEIQWRERPTVPGELIRG